MLIQCMELLPRKDGTLTGQVVLQNTGYTVGPRIDMYNKLQSLRDSEGLMKSSHTHSILIQI